jgi:hypothetical protein
MNPFQLSTILALILACSLAACGSDQDESQPPAEDLSRRQRSGTRPAPSTSPAPSMTREQRAKYCFVGVELETDEAVARELLEKLAGTWKWIPADRTNGYAWKTFEFSPERRYAAITSRHAWTDKEELTYRKACVSRPLGREFNELVGFRIVELMAANNEGGVAFALKFDPPAEGHDYPTLQMTERHYSRWAANAALATPLSVVENKLIYAYPNRE